MGALITRCGAVPLHAQSASSFQRLPGVDGSDIWVGGSVGTHTAKANENIHGSLRLIGVQWTHDLFAFQRARVELGDRGVAADACKSCRASYGFGVAPLSAQAEIPLRPRLSTRCHVTSGAAWFSKVVPYGNATHATFTVSPGVSRQWETSRNTRLAFGYTMHHLSNASFGHAHRGMNSRVFYTRIGIRE